MNSRRRLQTALNHKTLDHVCVDFGATNVSGIAVSTLARLRRAVLGGGSGFVFTSVRCDQANVPVENLLAMFKDVHDA